MENLNGTFQTNLGYPYVVTSSGDAIYPGIAYVYDSNDSNNFWYLGWGLTNYINGASAYDINSFDGPRVTKISTPSQSSLPAYGINPAGPFTFTDTIGTSELTISPVVTAGPPAATGFTGPAGPAGPCAQGQASETYTYPTSTGTASVTLTCKSYSIKTAFAQKFWDGFEYDVEPEWPDVVTGSSNPPPYYTPLIDTITLADGSSYHFSYESAVSGTVTGRISQVIYPNGGIVQYTYGPVIGKAGGYCNYYTGYCYNGDGTPSSLTRTDASGTTTYTRSPTYGYSTVVGPAPANNTTVYQFTQAVPTDKPPQGQQDSQTPWFLAWTTWKQGAHTSLKESITCYNGVGASDVKDCSSAPFSTPPAYPITQVDTYTQVGGSGYNRVTKTFDAYQNVTREIYYDYNATTPTRQIVMSQYGYSWNGSTCVLINGVYKVNNVPCQVEVQDGTGTPLRNTYYTYDSNGNLLSKSTWASGAITGGTYLTNSYKYNSNGTVSSTTDANGNQTSLAYGACNNGMLTTVTVWPVASVRSLSDQLRWDSGCSGAVVTSITDPNGNPKSFSYNDPFWRLTSSTDELQNTLNSSYTPTTVESQMSFNGGSSDLDAIDTTDSLGRPLYTQVIEGPGGTWDTQQSGYAWDSTGIVTSVTMPCVSTKGSGCSTPQTTVTHDALGRPLVQTDGGGGTTTYTYSGRDVLTVMGPAPAGEVVKQVQQEYNGLGQLLSSCQLSSATGSTSCGQRSAGTGFVTKYLYNPDGTIASISRKSSTKTQTHSFTYDAMGRTLTVTYPESGTKQFFYDVPPATPGVACSTIMPPGTPSSFYGQLVKTYDANGNTACYAYDGVNRVTSISFNGPNFDGNNKYFVYDSATVDGAAMANAGGRLAEAYTAPSVAGTKNTDEGYSYTARGQVSDVYQFSTNSGGYYHTAATYFANGVINTLSGVPGQPAWTYSIDGKGRLYSAIQGTSTNLVSSATYNAADEPCVITLGLGDTDAYVYDNNPCSGPLVTGRMTNYTFTIGAKPESISGTLAWNQNGTLRQLAITDGINTGGTQTCNYGTSATPGYDELGRLVSVDCGASMWQQNFAYDAFSNLTKTVPGGGTGITWAPGYNQANNQYLGGGTNCTGATICYDANGHLLKDTFHTYTWNQDDRPLSVVDAGVTATYDALGNGVERKTGSTYSETLLSPVGKLGVMNQQNVSQFRVPLPGGPTAVSGINFWHKDWLGSVRFVSSLSNRTSYADRAFAPYGETYNNIGATTNVNFTGDSQDLVAGTFDTLNRELNPNQGRWISPDPAHAGWNAYAYSTNPLSTTDPAGLDDEDDDDDWLYSGLYSTSNFFNLGNSGSDCNVSGNGCFTLTQPGSDPQTFPPSAWGGPSGSEPSDYYGHWGYQDASGKVVPVDNWGPNLPPLIPAMPTLAAPDNASQLAQAVSNLTSPSSLSEVGVKGIMGAQLAEGIWSLPSLGRSAWGWFTGGAFSSIGSTGKVGERWLAENLGGNSQVYFNTTQGGRYVDQLANGIANESKVGYQSLTPTISVQISKDSELLNSARVQGYNWHFFQSPVTGLGGPSQPLANALEKNGINVIIHF